jgi:hypothetical protein
VRRHHRADPSVRQYDVAGFFIAGSVWVSCMGLIAVAHAAGLI